MADDVRCLVCGGQDFYKEAGYYFCNECQTQTQDVQEHAHEEPEDVTNVKQKSKKIRKEKGEPKPENQLTTWECYNYILLGLVNEVIELGADPKLKRTVKVLWYKYLQALQVIHNDPLEIPRLPAINCQRDAEILYGLPPKQIKRKRRRSGSSESNADSVSTSSRRDKAKRQRELTKAEYEEFLSTQQSDSVSIHNQSLHSFKSTSETSSKTINKPLDFNNRARKELLKRMSKGHLKSHRHDPNETTECHSLSWRGASDAYKKSADILTRNKLFGLIYLGLLIIKDPMQLGDLLRFVREGHISYNQYMHFFPEELANTKLNIGTYAAKTAFLSHHNIRMVTAKLAVKLNVTKYVPIQNLVELCSRYCKELNLPNEFANFTTTLVSRAPPVMSFQMKSSKVPNYEARAMSLIVFSLKMLFGLDGATENYISMLATDSFKQSNMNFKQLNFDFNGWLKFLLFRKQKVMSLHFPSAYHEQINSKVLNLDKRQSFIRFLDEYKSKYESKTSENIEILVLKNTLEKLKSLQEPLKSGEAFQACLTPFYSYFKDNTVKNNNFKGNADFVDYLDTNLDFVVNPKVNNNTEIVHGGANDKIQFIPFKSVKLESDRFLKENRKLILVEFGNVSQSNDSSESTDISQSTDVQQSTHIPQSTRKPQSTNNNKDNKPEINSEKKLEWFHHQHKKTFDRNKKRILKNNPIKNCDYTKGNKAHKTVSKDSILYNPDERFWLQSHDFSRYSQERFEEFFDTLPYSFQLVVKECSRIIEQPVKDFYEEYNLAELHLCYNVNFREGKPIKNILLDTELSRLLKVAAKNW